MEEQKVTGSEQKEKEQKEKKRQNKRKSGKASLLFFHFLQHQAQLALFPNPGK